MGRAPPCSYRSNVSAAPSSQSEGIAMMRSLLLAAAILGAASATAAAQDASKGEHVFNMCRPCHDIGPDAANKLGPELNSLDGRRAGSVADYPYSDANKKSGIVWNEATFKQYIQNPAAMVPGTKMFFTGITNKQEIDDLWAYVSQFDADGQIKKK
jgi:cytochrome c